MILHIIHNDTTLHRVKKNLKNTIKDKTIITLYNNNYATHHNVH